MKYCRVPPSEAGSSPLARGLHTTIRWVKGRVGIIPARAGFTCTAGSSPLARGSSPLARGLPLAWLGDHPVAGIIPARAGFTTPPGQWSSGRTDHPRSRGVYRPSADAPTRTRGSSPLARGLPRGGLVLSESSRIIPARAGFTCATPSTVSTAGDHPRSRGVYPCPWDSASESSGSSPLARGLQKGFRWRVQVPGIIPARAGFTCSPARSQSRCRDHPRSRGVYTWLYMDEFHLLGSSPLARGLPGVHGRATRPQGIIPARAGFTSPMSSPCQSATDHPRSRGVYFSNVVTLSVSDGSSPLARGLLRWHRRCL